MRLAVGACFFLFLTVAAAQNDAVSSAIAALQAGDLPAAERILQQEVGSNPRNSVALEVLGVVLDRETKFPEADVIYRRALAASAPSAGLLNNYGNHLLSTGQIKEAQSAFRKVLALEPRHPNAGVQLARLALDQHAPAEAAHYLEHLPAEILHRPDVSLLRMRAAYGAHRDAEADALFSSLSTASHDNAPQTLALGEALAAAGQYGKAETTFARALELQPANFDALYDLGLAAAHAGHNDRARQTLEQALDKQPENAGVLYDLAAVDLLLNRGETSLELLARARKLAPERPDVHLLLARTAAQLGYFGDAVQAWEAYLKLKPADEIAQREHAFAEMALPVNTEAALADLRAFTRRHPADATGHYELGLAESPTDPEAALPEISRALTLNPHFAAAHLVRGLLLYHLGKLPEAVIDFEKANAEDPSNPVILERLGQNYLALDRQADALRTLRQAEKLAPQNPGVLLQLGRALTKAGQTEEAAAIFTRYRQLGPAPQGVPHPAGLVDFLSLSPSEQLARYRTGVERTVEKNPENAEAQVRYLGLLLTDGKIAEARAVARKLDALQPAPAVLHEAVQLLLHAADYATAKEIVDHASQQGITSADLQLDLAISTDLLSGAASALEILQRIPPAAQTGDYHLALARALEEAGKSAEAAQSIRAALQAHPARAVLYRSTAVTFLDHDHLPPAVPLLERAIKEFPEDPTFRVLQAVALAASGTNSAAAFTEIENRWPEWAPAFIAEALVLESSGQTAKAEAALNTAKALGASVPSLDAPGSPANPRQQLLHALSQLFGS